MQKTSLLFFIAIIFFSSELFCQNLYLKIEGNTIKETSVIDSLNYLEIHENYKSITFEVDSVQNKLYNKGYIENELRFIKKINDSTFKAQLLLKRKFNTIYIYYNKNEIDPSIINAVSSDVFEDYFKLTFSEVENALNFINSRISEKGFPFSKLSLSNIKIKESNNLEGQLTIQSSGEKRIINNIVVKGYEKFPKSYLKHFLKIKPTQVFDLNKIQSKTEQLNALNFASEIKSPEVLFSKDSTTLYLYLQKTKSNAFDGFLGFGTNEETNKLEFDGYLNLNLVNNLNYGESFRLLYKSDENDQKTFEAEASMPYLFKSPIGLDLLLRIFKRDSSFTTTNQSAKLHYQINANHKIYAGITSTESNSLLAESLNAPISNYKTNYVTLAYQFLKPNYNNFLFPLNSKLYFEYGFGNRKTFNNKENQTQITLDAFKIFNLNSKNSIYIRTNVANITSSTYLENELLRFGGINSIRGFEENSLFSNIYGLINTEYRFQMGNSIYAHTIVDAAYFENKIINTKEKLFGYGLGLGIYTKAGLFRLNYANGKIEDSKFKLANSKIHVSLTSYF